MQNSAKVDHVGIHLTEIWLRRSPRIGQSGDGGGEGDQDAESVQLQEVLVLMNKVI